MRPSRTRRLAGIAAVLATACLSPLAATSAGADRGRPGDSEGLTDRSASSAISMDRVVVPMVFPLVGGASYSDTFLVCRSGCTRKHLGQDLMAPKMRPLVATFNGVVSSLKRESYVGEGNYLTITGDNGWTVNYIHVNNDRPGTDDGQGTAAFAFAPGLRRGSRVVAGQLVGWNGDSGNAESTAPHTHFELRRGGPWDGVVYNAKPSLDAAPRLRAPRVSGPHTDGTLLQADTGGPVWVLEQGRKRLVSANVLRVNGWRAEQVLRVSKAEVDAYPRHWDLSPRDGVVLQGPDGVMWLVTSGRRIKVPSVEALVTIGVRPTRVRAVDAATVALVWPAEAGVALPGPVHDGALVRRQWDPKIYAIVDGERRHVPDIATMTSWGYTYDDLWPVAATAFDGPVDVDAGSAPGTPATPVATPDGGLLPLRDATVARHPVGGWLWIMEDGEKRHVTSTAAYRNYGYGSHPVLTVPVDTLTRQPDGPSWP